MSVGVQGHKDLRVPVSRVGLKTDVNGVQPVCTGGLFDLTRPGSDCPSSRGRLPVAPCSVGHPRRRRKGCFPPWVPDCTE